MTIAISSYQRRRELERLLRTLAGELEGRPELAVGVDVVVVLDGSTDGSREMVERLPFPVPLRATWQPNAGLAAARNAGLANASGELVWFLDDDLLLPTGTLARHRRADVPDDRRVLVGPCRLIDDHRIHPEVRWFWDARHSALTDAGVVTRFDHFSAANTSGPVATFDAVGGFDPGFVGYGADDYELAVRLLDAGVTIAYDPAAVAWHAPPHGVIEMCTRAGSEARNQIRLATLHPSVFDDVFAQPFTPPMRWIRRAGLHRHPRLLGAIAALLTPLASVEARVTRQRATWVLGSASAARYVAEVAKYDPDGRVMARVLHLADANA
jgi:glycosyltransferase involved in cell wall biosynthesis